MYQLGSPEGILHETMFFQELFEKETHLSGEECPVTKRSTECDNCKRRTLLLGPAVSIVSF